MLKKLKEIFKDLDKCIVDLFKEIFGIKSPSEEASVTYCSCDGEVFERMYEQRRLFQERMRAFDVSHNCRFKVGDKVKIKEDVCKTHRIMEYINVEFIVNNIKPVYDPPSDAIIAGLYVSAYMNGALINISGNSEYFEPYQDYSNLVSFIKSLEVK